MGSGALFLGNGRAIVSPLLRGFRPPSARQLCITPVRVTPDSTAFLQPLGKIALAYLSLFRAITILVLLVDSNPGPCGYKSELI